MFKLSRYLLVLLGLMVFLPVTIAQESLPIPPEVTILGSPNSLNYPQINLKVVVRDNNQGISGLGASAFTLSEPYDANLIQVQPATRPTLTALIVELPSGSEVDLIQQTLTNYLESVYQEGDTVLLYYVGRDASSGITIQTADDFRAAVNNLSARVVDGRFPLTLERSLGDLQNTLADNPEVWRQALVIGSYFNNVVNLDAAITGFTNNNIPIYSIQVRGTGERGGAVANYEALAVRTGGLYVDNVEGQAITGLNELFNRLNLNRAAYEITYISTNQDLNPQRNVTLTVNLPNGQTVNTLFSYEPVFLDPQVAIVEPSQVSPQRTIEADGSLSPNQVTLTAQITFPDGVTRPLSRLTFQALDATTRAEKDQVILEAPVLDAENKIPILWDITDYNIPNETVPMVLVVTVEDSLGRSAQTERQGSVNVGLIPPTATALPTNTPAPTNTVPPTNTPLPTATEFVVAPPIPGVEISGSSIESILLILLIAIVLLAVVIVILLYTRPGQRVAAAATTAMQKTEVYRRATEIFGGSTQAASSINPAAPTGKIFGELIVLKGYDDASRIVIDRSPFIVGRELALSHYQINRRYMSATHFSIIHRNNSFFIMDEGSSNGTRVNGERLRPKQEYPLAVNSIISIVELELQLRPSMGKPTEVQFGAGMGDPTAMYGDHTAIDTGRASAGRQASPPRGDYQNIPPVANDSATAVANTHDDMFSGNRPRGAAGPRSGGTPSQGTPPDDSVTPDWGF